MPSPRRGKLYSGKRYDSENYHIESELRAHARKRREQAEAQQKARLAPRRWIDHVAAKEAEREDKD